VFTIGAGTLAAIALTPLDYTLPGALRPSALVMTAGFLAPVLVSAIRRPMDAFRAENLLLGGFVYWIFLDLLLGKKEPQDASASAVRSAFLSTGLMGLGVCVANAFPAWRLPAKIRRAGEVELPPMALFYGILVCFGLAMTHYIVSCEFDLVLMIEALGRSRFAAPWSGSRLGNWRAFQEHLVYFGYLVPTLTVLHAHLRGWKAPPTVTAIVCSLIIVLFTTQGGSRGEVGVVAGAAILTWLLLQRRMTWAVGIRLFIAMFVLLAWMQLMMAVRNDGMAVLFSPNRDRATEQLAESKIDVDDNFNRLCQVMDLIPERIGHTHGGQLFYVLVRPIPRVFWPDKPIGPGFSFEMEVSGDESTTWSVTAVGEFYYDFGLPFVFLGGLFYGRLAGMWNQLLTVRRGIVWPMLYGLGAMALFAGVRSQQAFLLRTYPILFWLVLSALLFRPAPSETANAPAGAPGVSP
jgi:oligosaccharide repeat unit polymerase